MIRYAIRLLLLLLAVPPAFSQEKQSGVTVRIFAVATHPGQGRVAILSGDESKEIGEPFEIPVYELTASMEVGSRAFSIVDENFTPEEKPIVHATVKLPDKGRDFRVILIPSSPGKYKQTVVRADGSEFKSGDVLMLNLAKSEIVANIGNEAFAVKPGSRHIVDLDGAIDNSYYNVLIGKRTDGKILPISETRWPVMRNNRSYVIMFQSDPHTIARRGIDEFISPDE